MDSSHQRQDQGNTAASLVLAVLFLCLQSSAIEPGRGVDTAMQSVFNSEMAKTKGMTKTELRRLREAAGLSQTGLAKKIGYSQASVSRWEAGKETPIPERAQKLITIMTYQSEPERATA